MTEPRPSAAVAPLRKLARLRARPGYADALRAALIELEAPTRREAGCREFSFFQALTDPEAFVLLETFADQAAFDAHMAAPYTQAFFRAELVAGVEVETRA